MIIKQKNAPYWGRTWNRPLPSAKHSEKFSAPATRLLRRNVENALTLNVREPNPLAAGWGWNDLRAVAPGVGSGRKGDAFMQPRYRRS